MIVEFSGKQVVLPQGYRAIAGNRFISGGGTEYRLVKTEDMTIRLEAVDGNRRRSAPLEIIGEGKVVNTVQFINNYLKCKALVSIKDLSGILYSGTVGDLPRSLVENTVITGISGFGSINDIVISIEPLDV